MILIQKLRLDHITQLSMVTNITYKIIPKLKPHEEWGLQMGDTIIFNLDDEILDLNAARQIYKIMAQSFPDNNIIILLGDNKITVLKDNN